MPRLACLCHYLGISQPFGDCVMNWGIGFAAGTFFGLFINWVFSRLNEMQSRKKQVLRGRRR